MLLLLYLMFGFGVVIFWTTFFTAWRWTIADRRSATARQLAAEAVGEDRQGRDYRVSTLLMWVLAIAAFYVATVLLGKIGWYQDLPLDEKEHYYGSALGGLMALLSIGGVIKLCIADDVTFLHVLGIVFFGLLAPALAWHWWWYDALGIFRVTFILGWVFVGLCIWRYLPRLVAVVRREWNALNPIKH